ncbi:MAG: OmpA family protein [Nitrospirota bacterium]|nr:OmpA family protein [Nitrospirota bacterium]
MKTIQLLCVMFMGTMVIGCMSQQAHERAMEELASTQQNSTQEVERLQQDIREKEVAFSQLEETLNEKEKTVAQLQEANNDLEATVEVQEQLKEKNLEALKQELQALYSQVTGLGKLSGATPASYAVGMNEDGVDFDDLAKAFQNVRSTLASQLNDFSQLRKQNEQLEEEMQKLEARLRHVEHLKKELEEVRAAREAQEAQLARVKGEVQTVGREIDRITKALEEKFGKSLMVTQHQDRLVLTMLGQVLFDSGEAHLTPLGLDIMKQVGQVLATLPNKNIQVEGHTDNNPIYGRLKQQYPTNWELSTARATTVLRFLIEQTGMDPQEFAATGYADTRPAVPNDSEEGQAQNRRVEIVLYPERVVQDNKAVATLAQ